MANIPGFPGDLWNKALCVPNISDLLDFTQQKDLTE